MNRSTQRVGLLKLLRVTFIYHTLDGIFSQINHHAFLPELHGFGLLCMSIYREIRAEKKMKRERCIIKAWAGVRHA